MARDEPGQVRFRCDHPGAHVAPPGGEVPRCHQTIAAIVAAAGDHGDCSRALADHVPRAARDLPAGDLHQLQR